MTQRTLCRARGAPICNFSLISAGAHGLGISVFFCAGCEIEIGDGVAAWLKYGQDHAIYKVLLAGAGGAHQVAPCGAGIDGPGLLCYCGMKKGRM